MRISDLKGVHVWHQLLWYIMAGGVGSIKQMQSPIMPRNH